MKQFPMLLFEASSTLTLSHCQPDEINETSLLYSKENYDNCRRSFELDIVWQPDGILIKRLFVRPEMQGRGIGRDIITALKQTSKLRGFKSIMLQDVLPDAVGFWEKQEFHIVRIHGIWWNIELKRPGSK